MIATLGAWPVLDDLQSSINAVKTAVATIPPTSSATGWMDIGQQFVGVTGASTSGTTPAPSGLAAELAQIRSRLSTALGPPAFTYTGSAAAAAPSDGGVRAASITGGGISPLTALLVAGVVAVGGWLYSRHQRRA